MVVGTLGKALGSYGAYVCASEEMVRYLINTARSLIFSTAPPPPAVAGALAALELLQERPHRVERLRSNARALRRRARRRGLSRGRGRDAHRPADRRRGARGDAPLPGGARAGRVRPGDPAADGARRDLAPAPGGDGLAHGLRAAHGREACSARRRARSGSTRRAIGPAAARAASERAAPTTPGADRRDPRGRRARRRARGAIASALRSTPSAPRSDRELSPFDRGGARATARRSTSSARAAPPARPERETRPAAPRAAPRRSMRGLFVTGTDTGVGKTVLSAALLAAMAAAGEPRARAQAGRDRPRRAERRADAGRPTTSCSPRRRAWAPRRSRRCATARPSRRTSPRSSRASASTRRRLLAGRARARRARRPLIVEGVGGLLVAARRGLHRARPRRRARAAACVIAARARARHDQPHAAHAARPPARRASTCARSCSRRGRAKPSELERSNRETIARTGRGRGRRRCRPSSGPEPAELARAGASAAVAAVARSAARGARKPARGDLDDRRRSPAAEILAVDDVWRHRVDQVAKRAQPHAALDGRGGRGRDVDRRARAAPRRSRRARARRATPGSSRAGSRPARSPRSIAATRARQPPSASSSSEASATAQASGLAMNVGPCISPPPSPRGDRLGDRARAERRGERHVAAGERLADAHHVRRDAGVLAGEQRAGAPEAGRDLVEHEQQAVLVAQPRAAARRTPASGSACRPRPARPARRSPPPARRRAARRARCTCAAQRSSRPRVEAVGRALGEHVLRQHAGEQAVHPADRVAHGHRAERVAVVAAPHGQQPRALAGARRARWNCRHILIATSTDDRAGVGEEHRAPAPRARARRRRSARRTAGSCVSPPNITCAIRSSCSRTARVERRVAVAVDRAPPRGHPVDQLAPVGELQAHALRPRRPAAGRAPPGSAP